VLTHPLLDLRQGHLGRLRPAHRRGACSVLGCRTLRLRELTIAEARAAALVALTTSAAGDSLCTLSRERLPAAKYHEGAVAALGDALRAARLDEALPAPDSWGAQWQHLAEKDPGWRAYLAGGRDALTRLGARSQ